MKALIVAAAVAASFASGMWFRGYRLNEHANQWAAYRYDEGVVSGWCAARRHLPVDSVHEGSMDECEYEGLAVRRGRGRR